VHEATQIVGITFSLVIGLWAVAVGQIFCRRERRRCTACSKRWTSCPSSFCAFVVALFLTPQLDARFLTLNYLFRSADRVVVQRVSIARRIRRTRSRFMQGWTERSPHFGHGLQFWPCIRVSETISM